MRVEIFLLVFFIIYELGFNVYMVNILLVEFF